MPALALLSAIAVARAEPAPRPESPPPAKVVLTAEPREIEDLKSVLATVRSKKVIEARVRTPGTVATLTVAEGALVEAGQVLGTVVDPKIALRLRASDAQIVALQSRLTTAKAELERTAELMKRGVAPQARLDQAQTAFDVATNDLSAARSERDVILKQAEEGEVLAPSAGRVLRVPVTEGSVVMAGESIASIAADEYLLRLEVPERHARHMRAGDILQVAQRDLTPEGKAITEGRISLVYPEIQAGRVVADAEVTGLGDYFVGERTMVWISAGKRQAIVLPAALTFKRFGIDYVRILNAQDEPVDTVVQLGQAVPGSTAAPEVEILSGLVAGDRVVQP
jgi:RND family efflux transporter MFP subunit